MTDLLFAIYLSWIVILVALFLVIYFRKRSSAKQKLKQVINIEIDKLYITKPDENPFRDRLICLVTDIKNGYVQYKFATYINGKYVINSMFNSLDIESFNQMYELHSF